MTDKTTGIFTISSRKGLNYADEREREFVEYTIKREREVLIADMIQKLRPNIPHTIVFGDTVERPAEYSYGEPVVRLEQLVLVAVSHYNDAEAGEACVAEFPATSPTWYEPPRFNGGADRVFKWEDTFIFRVHHNHPTTLHIWRRIA